MAENTRFAWKGNLVAPNRVIHNGLVVAENRSIIFAGPMEEWDGGTIPQVEEISDGWILPGLIDLHVHGLAGCDVMDGTPEALLTISAALASYGVTGFLPTTITSSEEDLLNAIDNVTEFQEKDGAFESGAAVLGIHIEGPWIHPRYRGAMNESFITQPSLSQAKKLYDRAKGLLKIVTLAPELPGALEVVRYLSERKVTVSAGHTGAGFEQIAEALQAGLTQITHCFNAMTGLHHREPGAVGAAMYFEGLRTELIADNIHVHPHVANLLYRLKKQSLILISDCTRAGGMPNGVYDLGGQSVQVEDGKATLPDGTLAGSLLTLNRAIKNMVESAFVPLEQAVSMASLAPAAVLGIDDRKGRLCPGYDADITVLNRNFDVAATWVGGRKVFDSN
ncbi:N-acetylglucosamine-6-phosphate deacetylase [Paenibacillus hamazuiensis]|uniref:N-acetylglucosamine-6-phosphate deacetylase n=1 Tax=Paenibacillus hamazuiensis TaxID=2936508 RepID=UPI00200D8AFB|nr:N-acetylglucosamine-6-phosphate deacetylase [Paenibacillus hamazuiensis]